MPCCCGFIKIISPAPDLFLRKYAQMQRCMKNKITCLLIDEQPDQRIQFYLALDLLKVNRACVCHDNSFDALAYLKQHTGFEPDYIFISSAVPKAHAEVFIKHIRKIERLEQAPVILLLAGTAAYSLPEISGTGFTDCLVKQCDIYFLRDALRMIFEKSYQFTIPAEEPRAVVNSLAPRLKEVISHTGAPEAPRRLSA
jgi:DNA-binding response OmpR family regulator